MVITAIREKASGWFVWLIVGLICITFALWGIQEYLDGLNRVVVANVNGEEIDYDDYQNELNNRRENLRRAFGGRVDPSMFTSNEFKTQTVENMIAQRLLAADVRESGYRISDAQLNTLIQNFPAFKNEQEQFDKNVYELTLQRQGLTPAAFESMQRQQNAVDQIRNGFSQSAFVTEAELTRLLALTEETRTTDIAAIPYARFDDEISVSEEEAKTHYDENQESFRAPDRVKVQFVELSVSKLMNEITVAEEDVRTAYDENRNQYVDEERRSARHILIKLAEDSDADTDKNAFEKAQAILEKAKSGEDFAELAKTESEDTGSAAQGGDLGLVGRGVMVKPFEDALFSMTDGSLSEEPVRSRFGYHIIKLEKIEAERVKEYDEVREELSETVKRSQALDRFSELSEEFRNVVFEQPDTLDSAAVQIGETVQSTDWFTQEQGTGLFSNPTVRAAAFSDEVLKEDLNSQAIEVDDDTLIAVRKAEYEPSTIRPFEDVKTEAEAAVKTEKTAEAAKKLGEELIAKLGSGEIWEEVLAAAELVPAEGPSKRKDPDATPVNRALVEEVFKAAIPAADKPVYGGQVALDSQYVIYRLSEVAPGEPDKVEETAREQLTQRLRQRIGDEAFLSYQEELRTSADVTILENNIVEPPSQYQ